MATKKGTGVKTAACKGSPKAVNKKTASNTKGIAKSAQTKRNTTEINSSIPKRFGDSILDEIILILIILISVLVMISLLSNNMGIAGDMTSTFLKGIFGAGAFMMPILVIIYCIWMLMSETKKYRGMRLVAAVLFLITVSTLFHTFSSTGYEKSGFIAFYKVGTGINGGAFGGVIGNYLIKAFDKLGTYLIIISSFLISIIMGTGKSFLNGIYKLINYMRVRKEYKNEKIKLKAERIREGEAERERQYRIKESRRERRTSLKKGNFNIKIGDDEGTNAEEVPIVEAMVFNNRKPARKFKNLEIYDFNKVVDFSSPDVENNKVNMDDDESIENFVKEVTKEEFEPIINSSTGFADDLVEEEKVVSDNIPEVEILKQDEVVEDIDNDKVVDKPEVIVNKNKFEPKIEKIKTDNKDTVRPESIKDEYTFPPIDILGKNTFVASKGSKMQMLGNAKKLEETLKSFGVDAKVIQINKGPTVTRYELSPSQGVKVSKIVNLADDIALNLAASGIRIEAPIPGKAAVGIEVPNKETQSVYLRTVIESETFKKFPSKLAFALGEDIAGNAVVTDIAKMPHLLIAGATGSGKSVCINTLITSILYKANPNEVKLLLVDPKVVELSVYNGIPHLLIPVVTDPKKAAGALNWAVREMLARYNDFAEHNVRDINGFNNMKKEKGETDLMAQIVIIIDELADLMMAAPGEVEDSICRLAQMARAAGIHLIIATQRPSVDIITGVIKANIPSRLAFAVSSGVDSRTILDMTGAEKLLGKGDMLFYPVGKSKPVRIQGAFVTDKEVENIVTFIKKDKSSEYDEAMIEKITSSVKKTETGEDSDEFFEKAMDLVVEKEKASTSMLQRYFRIGYNRAARIMDDLEGRGIIGHEEGSKPRKVLMTQAELEEYKKGKDAE